MREKLRERSKNLNKHLLQESKYLQKRAAVNLRIKAALYLQIKAALYLRKKAAVNLRKNVSVNLREKVLVNLREKTSKMRSLSMMSTRIAAKKLRKNLRV